MNGEQIYSQATEEIDKLEQAIRDGALKHLSGNDRIRTCSQ